MSNAYRDGFTTDGGYDPIWRSVGHWDGAVYCEEPKLWTMLTLCSIDSSAKRAPGYEACRDGMLMEIGSTTVVPNWLPGVSN